VIRVHHRDELSAVDLDNGSDIRHVVKRVLVGPDHGAEGFVMRLFTLGTGGSTPSHTHPWEHEVYVLRGTGALLTDEGEQPLCPGHAAFVPAGARHRFATRGEGPFEFICVVPREGEG